MTSQDERQTPAEKRDLQDICHQMDQLVSHMLFHTQPGGCAMSSVTTPSINGINVEQLGANISSIQDNTELAKFPFRATNTWIHGGRNRTTIREFYGLGKEDTLKTEHFTKAFDS
ncbi:MAG TPA: hypothetical protein PKK23_16040 [Nitrospirales bacterium]|nr:hypothetical protein [Nitrospirales bacterium]